jgi:hypothetical protein
MQDYLVLAIRKLKPEAEFTISNEDYATIVWHVLEGAAPTQAEIDAAIKQVKVEDAQAETDKAASKAALLERLGITADEAALLLG